MKNKIYAVLFFTVLLLCGSVNAQTCGFGCLGFSGIYAGYSFQFISADGFSDYVENEAMQGGYSGNTKFDKAYGFRIGANLFRAKFDNYFLTLKGFYQFLGNTKTFNNNQLGGVIEDSFDLKLNYWGFAADFGVPIAENKFDWKIAEAGITFNKIELETTSTFNQSSEVKYLFENQSISTGYYVGTGFVIHFVKRYLSLETTAVYHSISVDEIYETNGESSYMDQINKTFYDGGFGFNFQLNLDVPL